ncbi:MAG TPA: hypothetical protein VEA61_09450 [Allosphingosinicella sp.]|nr:hypothetical protein [Allosphingosinicella sp.]
MTAERGAQRRILATWTAGGLWTRDGEPVWPLRDFSDLEALETLAGILGGRVELVDDAVPGRPRAEGDAVIALGGDCAAEAALYAHLTGRRLGEAASLEQLAALPAPAVVVTAYDQVDETLLDLLYNQSTQDAPGLVFAFPGDDLRRQILARAAALRLSPSETQVRRIDLFPLHREGAAGGAAVLDGDSDPQDYRDALAAGAALLTLSTHSDGIDAQLRPGLVLCGLRDDDVDAAADLAPSCVRTGLCHRRERPIAEARAAGELFDAGDVAAGVFVQDVCWGLYPAPGVQSPRWALSRRLLESFRVGALLTTWEIVGQTAHTCDRLFDELTAGRPLGSALGAFLRSDESVRAGHRLCLVGDPAIRIADGWRAEQAGVAATPRPADPGAVSPPGALALLRLMIMAGRESQRPGRPDTSNAALSAVLLHEMALASNADASATGEALRDSAADYFAERYTDTVQCWIPYASDVETASETRPCLACGRRVITRAYRLAIAGAGPRIHAHCPTCGPVRDGPEGLPLAVVPEADGRVRIAGVLPSSDWSARLVIDTQLPQYRRVWRWPAGEDGAPAQVFVTPERWPPLPFRLALLLVEGDGTLRVSGCLTRGERDKRNLPASTHG